MEWLAKLCIALSLALVSFVISKAFPKPSVWRAFEYLNWFLFYVVIPLTIFKSVAKTPNIPVVLALIAACCIHMVLCSAIALACCKRMEPRSRITIALLASLPNVVFLAFPLAIALLGSVAPVVPYAVSFNLLLPIYIAFLSRATGRSGKAKPKSYPHIAAFLVGLIVNYLGASSYVLEPLSSELASTCLTVLNLSAFAVIGSELARVSKLDMPRIGIVMILRLCIAPLLMTCILLSLTPFIRIPKIYALGTVMQSLMAPAVTNVILAKAFELDTVLASSAVATLTPISIAIATALALLANR